MMKLRKAWEEYLRDPPLGSKAFEAKEFGIDMEGLIANLKLTPAERIKENDRLMNEACPDGNYYEHFPAWSSD